jgi:hypothetical protein
MIHTSTAQHSTHTEPYLYGTVVLVYRYSIHRIRECWYWYHTGMKYDNTVWTVPVGIWAIHTLQNIEWILHFLALFKMKQTEAKYTELKNAAKW